MDGSVAGISFELSFDKEQLTAGIKSACKGVQKSFADSFRKAGKQAAKATQECSKEVKDILDDTQRSTKSKIGAIASYYKKAGYSSQEAFRKAWTHIERDSSDGAKKVKRHFREISKEAEKNSKIKAPAADEKQMSGIAGMAKKAGLALAGAFAVKEIVDFGKECINLGSDLAEVQNVVDVTFPKMKEQVNVFAKEAAKSFGLSETMAKQYAGAYGAMAKSFGFSEKQAYDMSTTLTGLAGDVASFYNMSQDEAYTKLKSVFSGETETLKDLGVVMTQNALDSYAMANGYGKVTAKMSEQEKVALRYKFVQDQLSASAGDFLRTSDSWANQTRLLSLQFDSLKASIGQGLINVFTPVLRVVNSLLVKLSALASAFAELTGKAFGKQEIPGTADSMEDVADAASDASAKTEGIGEAAKKSAKEAKRSTLSFDKMNKLSGSSDDSSGTGKGTGVKGNASSPAAGTGEEAAKKAGGLLDEVKKKFTAIQSLFAKGFRLGAGNIQGAVKSIIGHLKSIGSSLKDIFTDKNVSAAFKKMVSLFVLNAGKIVGSLASIGATIADNLLGGFDIFLQGNKDRIKSWLISMFDISGEIATISGNFSAAVAEIFSAFRSSDAKVLTAGLFTMVYSTFAGMTELFMKIGRDVLNFITQPIIDNKDKLKTALQNTIRPLSSVIDTIATTVSETWDKIQELYDTHIKPLIDTITDGVSEWMSTYLEGYNQYIAPVLDRLSARFKEVMEGKVKPAIDSVIRVCGEWCDTLKSVWENWIQPFVNWCIENIVPIFAQVFEEAGEKIQDVFGGIADIVKGVSTAFSGVCGIIKGIVEGNWSQVWEGAKTLVKGIWDAITGIFKNAWNLIKLAWSPAITFFKQIWQRIREAFSGFNNFLQNVFKKDFSTKLGGLGDIMNGLKENIKNVWDSVKKIFNGITTFISGIFTGNWTEAWEGVKTIFKGIFDTLVSIAKTPLNLIIGLINGMLSGISKGINFVIDKVNKLKFDVPDWVLGIGGKKFGFDLPKVDAGKMKIPYLAQGGYVKRNTPQLAVIGDNRHQGEVVAPEEKMLEMARQAAELAGGAGLNGQVVELLRRIIDILEMLDLNLYVDGQLFSKKMVNEINMDTKRTGRCALVIK